MKPLYLNGREPISVRLDGPALRIQSATHADRLFPLQRLNRVVVTGRVDWSTEALLACADRSVNISFLSRGGRLRARLLGKPSGKPPLELNDALVVLFEETKGRDRYRDWLDANINRARRFAAGLIQSDCRSMGSGELRRTITGKALKLIDEKELKSVDVHLAALLISHLETLMGKVSLYQDLPVLTVQKINIVRDLADILGWYLQPPKLHFLEQRRGISQRKGWRFVSAPRGAVIYFYEQNTELIEKQFFILAKRLHVFLLEIAAGYGN